MKHIIICTGARTGEGDAAVLKAMVFSALTRNARFCSSKFHSPVYGDRHVPA